MRASAVSRPAAALATLGACVAALALGPSGGAQAPSAVVDRRFTCATVRTFGAWRDLDILSAPRTIEEYDGVRNTIPAHVHVGSGVANAESYLVAIRTAPLSGISRTLPAGVYSSSRRCVASRKSVPLSRRGLAGPPVPWRKEVECQVRGRLLVRVRATLSGPAPWRHADPLYVGARREVISASPAIRSEATGAPAAYVELLRGGKTRLWHASRCA